MADRANWTPLKESELTPAMRKMRSVVMELRARKEPKDFRNPLTKAQREHPLGRMLLDLYKPSVIVLPPKLTDPEVTEAKDV